ncbi:hypothetical protein Neosp_009859 [[Neocosmospora] mangrovei]
MVDSMIDTPGDPPTETSNPANPTTITPGASDFTAFKDAIQQGNIEAVRTLIEKGADVNSWLQGEGTVLQIALKVAEPQIECVRMLLDNGANIYSKGGTYGNALIRAVDNGLGDVLDLMVQGGCVQNEAELPPDQRLHNDLTILHVAVCYRNGRALKRLLESPAKEMINHQDIWGRTPLHYAAQTHGTPSRDARWELHRSSIPTKSEFEAFKNDFIACQFTTTYPKLRPENGGVHPLSSNAKLESNSIELVRRSHVLLWTMVKSGQGYDGWSGKKCTRLDTAALITTSRHAELRSTILKSRGNDPHVIDRLLEDALSWVQMEEIANGQKSDLSELRALFVIGEQWKPHDRKIPAHRSSDEEDLERFRAAVGEFCEYLVAGVKNLRDTSQELIGLVSRVKPPNQRNGNQRL